MPSKYRSLLMSLWETSQNVGGIAGGALLGRATHTRQAFVRSGLGLAVASFWVLAVGLMARDRVTPADQASCQDMPENETSCENQKWQGEQGSPVEHIMQEKQLRNAKSQEEEPSGQMGESMWSAMGVPGVGYACSAYACVRSTRYLLMFWLPFHFAKEHSLDTHSASLASTCYDVAGVLGTLLAGRLHDLKLGRLSDPRTLSACCLAPGGMVLLLLDLHPQPLTVFTSILSLSLVAAGAEVADFLLVGPTALEISTRSGHGAKYMGRIAGLISGLAALVSALMQAFAVDFLGPDYLIKLIVAMQWCGIVFILLSARADEADRQDRESMFRLDMLNDSIEGANNCIRANSWSPSKPALKSD
eukprot:gb/GEZN01005734.1/.p1 GENE.gb/GEZN01005734.1/~~gb/GEZN01005734.1/.p1  ORF type:complete len:361 (+),score=25.41 gb/GEZN01005734.1/:382-1464(+)